MDKLWEIMIKWFKFVIVCVFNILIIFCLVIIFKFEVILLYIKMWGCVNNECMILNFCNCLLFILFGNLVNNCVFNLKVDKCCNNNWSWVVLLVRFL